MTKFERSPSGLYTGRFEVLSGRWNDSHTLKGGKTLNHAVRGGTR